MDQEDIYKTILDYIDLIENGQANIEENLRVLEVSLDRLALAHSCTIFTFDETEYSEAPTIGYDYLRQLAVRRFPNFGLYNIPEVLIDKITEAEVLVGDAVDDVVDIARDLYEVAWRWHNTSPQDALWYFQFGYDAHWGEHLRWLQLYLYNLKRQI
jgi:hypothetical protein